MPQTQPRIIVRIELSPAAAAKLSAIWKRHGCTQLSALSRLVEWYAAQPQDIRSAIIGWTADHRKSTDLIIQQMLKGLKKDAGEQRKKGK